MVLIAVSPALAQAPSESDNQEPKTSPQTMQILSSYEGQTVESIELSGNPDITERYAQNVIQHAGEPFSKQKIDETIAALKQDGKRDGKIQEVQLQVEPEGNGVRVLLVLEPAIYFGMFHFPGAERFSYARLVQVSNFPPRTPFNRGEVQRDTDNLINFFRQQGYFQAQVDPEVKIDAAHGLANVFFNTTLNKKAKFGTAVISGTSSQQAESLADKLSGVRARMQGAAIRTGKTYRYGNVTRANKYLQSTLEKQNRLAAKVQPQGAEYHADTNRADIHFEVDTGPEIHVDVKGAHLWNWTRKSLLPVYQGAGVDPELVEEGRQALTSYFQAKGFFDVAVASQSRQSGSIDTITYQITKGKKHKVAAVDVAGNKNIHTDELLNQVRVQQGHLFSPGKFSDKLVRSSSRNLEALYKNEGYSSATVTPHVENTGGDIHVRFTVNEGPQDIVKSLTIEGAQTFPESRFAPGGLSLGEGKAYSQKLVESDRANIVAHYLKAGYLMASFRETVTAVSKNDPHHLNVIYHIYEGPEVYTSSVITLGREKTQQRLIDEDTATIEPERPLTETALLESESRLYEHTGVFDWVEVDPKRQITTQTQEDVLVKVHESKKNQMTYGFGFEIINRGGSVPSGTVALPNLPPIGLPSNFTTSQKTFYGPRGTFQYTRNHLRGKGETVSFTAFAGRLDQRVAGYYIDPRLFWTKWSSTSTVSYERDEENPIYSSRVGLASYQIQRFLSEFHARHAR